MNCLKCRKILDKSAEHYGLHPACFAAWFGVPAYAEFVGLTRHEAQDSDPGPNAYSENTSFFHGKFKKYSAELESKQYILKMKESYAPELPAVEYLSNQIGQRLSIPVAEFYLINFEGEITFITKNFVALPEFSDLKHIYHFRSGDDHTCEGLIKLILDKTNSLRDVNILIDTLLFDALIGNHDRHGRNLALIFVGGRSELSPIYDNVSYLGLEQGNMLKADFNPAGKVATRANENPSIRDYVKEFKRLGFEKNVKIFYSRVKLKSINSLVEESFCSDLMKEAIKKLIKKRYEELEDELNLKA